MRLNRWYRGEIQSRVTIDVNTVMFSCSLPTGGIILSISMVWFAFIYFVDWSHVMINASLVILPGPLPTGDIVLFVAMVWCDVIYVIDWSHVTDNINLVMSLGCLPTCGIVYSLQWFVWFHLSCWPVSCDCQCKSRNVTTWVGCQLVILFYFNLLLLLLLHYPESVSVIHPLGSQSYSI